MTQEIKEKKHESHLEFMKRKFDDEVTEFKSHLENRGKEDKKLLTIKR